MRSAITRTRTVVLLTAAALAATACGGSTDADDNASADEGAVASADGAADDGADESADGSGRLGTGDDYSVLAALGELPLAGDQGGTIQTADLSAASDVAGLTRPGTLDAEALVEWLNPLIGGPTDEPAPVYVPLASTFHPAWLGQHDEFGELMGWSLLDVDVFVEDSQPPYQVAVLAGDFDDTTLADLPEVGDGVHTVGEGADLAFNPEQASAVSPTGAPVRVAHQDGLLGVSPSTGTVAAWAGGLGTTAADDEALAAVAAALDEADVVSAVLVTGDTFGPGGILPTGEESLEETLELRPEAEFDAVGLGWAVEDGQSVITAAYHFGSEADAEASLPALEAIYTEGSTLAGGAPFSDYVQFVDGAQDGPVAVLTLEPGERGHPGAIATLLQRSELIFTHQ